MGFRPPFILLISLILIIETPTVNSLNTTVTCIVNWKSEKQVIDGFGGSGAFHQSANLMAYPEKERNQILDLLFSQKNGIGLSIVRNIIGDGGDWGKPTDGPTSSIEPQEGVWNWTGDEDQIWLMNEAKKRGCVKFVSTVWSPPAWMKTNNSVIKGGELRPDKYQSFADYLANYVRGYKEHHQIDIHAISLANEPGFAAPYSSCLWTGPQFKDFIKNYLTPTLKRDKGAVKVIMPEDMNFTESYAIDTLTDPQAGQGVDIIGSHAYDFKAIPFPYAKSWNKSIWQTEVSNIGFNDGSINDGLKYAKLLHDHLTITEVNAWLFWWLVAYKEGETLVHLNTDLKTFQTFKRLYTIGNYSRFVRPGYVRINTDSNPVADVFVTAYKDTDSEKFAIVAINNGDREQTIGLNLNGFPKFKAIVPYRTSAKENLAKLEKIPVSKNLFYAPLIPKSVTTFIAAENELPGELSFKEISNPIEAENFDGQSDIKLESCNEGGTAIVFTKKGAFTSYQNYNFYNAATCDLKIAVYGRGKLELLLDNPKLGASIGKHSFTSNVKKPVSWKKTVWETVSIPVEKLRGVKDFYVVFTPWDQDSACKLNWLEFKAPIKPPAGKIKIQMENKTITATTNKITPRFKIVNTGTVPVNLEKVKVRYFYTLDSEAKQQFECSGGSIPSSAVTGSIVEMKAITPQADFCLEIGFNNNAGSLEPKQEAEVHAVIASQGPAYRQDNDFSFNSKLDSLADWEAVSGYIDDKLCWGSEPSLLVNPGFENGTTAGWFNFGGPSQITVTNETSHTGANSVLVSGRTETWQGVAQDLMNLMKPGFTYEVSAWIKLKNETEDAGRVNIKRSDDSGDNYTWVDSKTISDEEWTYISGLYELNVTGALKALQLYTEGPGPGVEYYVDNVVVREVPSQNSAKNK